MTDNNFAAIDGDNEPTPAPDDLGDTGRAFWEGVVADYDLGPAEEASLLEVARTMDSIEDLSTAVREHGPVTPDGKPSPLLVELRQQRGTLVKLLGLLDLPLDDDADPMTAASRRGRAAARSRWGSASGRR